jgi:shikimate kinase
MNLRLKRTPGIYLVGFMGSGKSTVGRELAGRMGWSFFDLDDEIEAAEDMAISEIFATRGEAEFRHIESAMLRWHVGWIGQGRPAVVALGGGVFVAEANRQLVLENGVAVWLDCPWETVERRVSQASHRPLARSGSASSSTSAGRATRWRTCASRWKATTRRWRWRRF